ncbi:MAG TPA: NAD(P)/FAD-dependent oxidoreductase [Lacipirellulaceae bacterium]|nr:NAD(P)/FAD-dependent oxidoreductase [Lacipirellulaceae bacterium]
MTAPRSTPSLAWGVVGGGMLGLTLAHRLAQAGQRVTVLEAGPEIGGLAGAWTLGDVTWDKHYHVTLLSDSSLRELLDDLGLEQLMRWVETRTGFYTDGRLHSMSNTVEFLRFPPLGLLDKLRLGATIFAASRRRNWRPLERVLVADWLRKWSGERTFRKIWEPLLEAKLGASYRRTSAAFIWATIARMYAARRTGLKREMFGYVPGGYRRVLAHFAAALRAEGVQVRTSAAVSRVVSEPGGQVRVETTAGNQSFDRVVLTCPSAVIPELCPQLDERERALHRGIEYLGIICASVLMDRPLADFYVTNITDGGVHFTAVIEMTTLVPPRELGDQSLAYLPRYVSADDEAWQWSDAEIEDRFLSALEGLYPSFRRRHVRAFQISRARHVMALPTVDYSRRLPPMETSVPHVYAVNSAHIVKGTLNVNEVVELANEACAGVLLKPAGGQPTAVAYPRTNPATPSPEHHAEAAGELVARP